MMSGAGRFISFEGPEGAGKSTQARLLADWLEGQGYRVLATREPGGTDVGDAIRAVLFGPAGAGLTGLTEAFLMNASRAQLVEQLLRPALAAGTVVLCDRYADATIAYQGYGHGQDLAALRRLIGIATGGLRPDLTIYLDVPAEAGLERKRVAHQDGGELNRIDELALDFHRRVVAGYRELMKDEPRRWRAVDARRDPAAIQADVRLLAAGILDGMVHNRSQPRK
ncbi:MAG: dTMP kinase [Chloroflexota bacterium]